MCGHPCLCTPKVRPCTAGSSLRVIVLLHLVLETSCAIPVAPNACFVSSSGASSAVLDFVPGYRLLCEPCGVVDLLCHCSICEGWTDCGCYSPPCYPFQSVCCIDGLRNFCCLAQPHLGFYPFGEALNPGPTMAITCVNPSGVAGKEAHLLDLPLGIVNVSETHLSAVSMPTVLKTIRLSAQTQQRRLHVSAGAPVALRPQSLSVGTWSGVLQLSDLGCVPVLMPWENHEYVLGRAHTSKFFWKSGVVVGSVVYGWPTSPSWPSAHKATASLLAQLTREIVHGLRGPRYICGDFNGDETHFVDFDLWTSAGWIEIQTLWENISGHAPAPTYKGKTRPDRCFVSPELACHFRSAEVSQVFADHAALIGHFDMEFMEKPGLSWPMCAKIPWDCVDLDAWHSSPSVLPPPTEVEVDLTAWYKQFGKAFEMSLDSHCVGCPSQKLPKSCRGRGQSLCPVPATSRPVCPKPSRPGEAKLTTGIVSQHVAQWFRQLRRLQALLQNYKAASSSPGSIVFRLDTWRSILKAKGFAGGFQVWWTVRPHRLQGVVDEIPTCLPSEAQLADIHQDFETNFRVFEAWHARQRRAISAAAVEESTRVAFQRVIGKPIGGMDFLQTTQKATITSIAPDTFVATLDSEVAVEPGCVCKLDGVPATVRPVGPCQVAIESDLLLCPGQELEVVSFLTDTQDILQQVKGFWEQRWSRHKDIPAAHWKRIMDFVSAHMAPLPFSNTPLTLGLWDPVLARFHTRSARGGDSFDHLDLKRMPPPFKTALLGMLTGIEAGLAWPQQLRLGLGHCAPKHIAAATVGEFRPIIVFSTIYRAWSSLRSTAFLGVLGQHAGPRMRGFLPGREAGDIWFQMQALIEASLQDQSLLVGCSADVEKAFESIPRAPLRLLGEALGLPSPFLSAWFSFLDGCERRFQLHGCVSGPITSVSGFPEGCGLSVLGMCLLDFCWDKYQLVSAPKVLSMSYVDNFDLLSTTVFGMLRAYAAMDTFMSLWELRLDSRKTFAWATDSAARASLRALGFRVCLTATELGGALSFSHRSAGPLQAQRLAGLDPAWSALRRLQASTYRKEIIIRQALWPRGFHAICITPLSATVVARQRTKAVRALGFGLAGAHPGIRLSLLTSDPTTDPCYFQLLHVFLDFRRLVRKQPPLISLWCDLALHEDRVRRIGPFGKLLEQAELIGWTISDPPFLVDHDGLFWDLLQMPQQLLRQRLLNAWMQTLAVDVGKRKDFAGLAGITWPPPLSDASLNMLERAQLNALREGTFLTSMQHSKYDMTKTGRCCFCGFEDTMEHRVLTCPRYHEVRSRHPEALRLWPISSVALREHLWPSRIDTEGPLMHAFCNLPDHGRCFMPTSSITSGEHHDLFTDGSFWKKDGMKIGLASWAVVSATLGGPLTAGPLVGPLQTICRAEVYAALSALRWREIMEVSCTLWSDSAVVVCGLHGLISGGGTSDFDSNEDLWEEIEHLIRAAPSGAIQVRHTPGHAATGYVQDADDWAGHWNQVADSAAKGAQSMRPPAFWEIWKQYGHSWNQLAHALKTFRDLHLDIAAQHPKPVPIDLDVEEPLEDNRRPPVLRTWLPDVEPLANCLPVQWRDMWEKSPHALTFGVEFVGRLLSFLPCNLKLLLGQLNLHG